MAYLGSVAVSATHAMTIFHTEALKTKSSSEIMHLDDRWVLGCQPGSFTDQGTFSFRKT